MVKILQILSHPFCMQNKQAYTPEVCCRITWAIIVDTWSFFYNIKLVDEFLENSKFMQFPVSMLDRGFVAIKHGIKIQRHNFPHEWAMQEPYFGPPGCYYLGKGGKGGYQPVQTPLDPPPGSWQLSGSIKPPPTQLYTWQPINFVDEHNPKLQEMMEPLLVKSRGQCLVSHIITASGKCFNCLPKLEKYPGSVC
jgi:hypothetical protein